MTQTSLQTLLALFGIGEEDRAMLAKSATDIDLKGVIDAFYERFTVIPETEAFFKNHDIDRLKKRQMSHWSHLLTQGADDEFIKRTRIVGDIHEKIGVTPEVYLAGYAFVFDRLLDQKVLSQGILGNGKARRLTGALIRMLMMDIAASLTAYVMKLDETSEGATTRKVAGAIIDDAVNASMGINHVFIDNLKASQLAAEVDHQVNSISAAIEEMSATVSTISNNVEQANDCTRKTGESTRHGRSVSDEAMRNMETIQLSVASTSDKSRQLAESSRKIEAIITKIQEIADQTNLLALNATIEAARAGDAGKGFAVVANEVKSLSNETTRATQEISEIIGQFVDSIQEIVSSMSSVTRAVETGQKVSVQVKDSMSEIEEHATQVSELMAEISKALSEQEQASNEISKAAGSILDTSGENRSISERNADMSRQASESVTSLIARVAEISDTEGTTVIKLAKSDHIIWKRKLADMLLGKAGLKRNELTDHTQCRLGQWYYGPGKRALGEKNAFIRLEEPHAEIHRLGIEAFELHNAGRDEEALKRLDRIEAVSQTVIGLLNDLDTGADQTQKN